MRKQSTIGGFVSLSAAVLIVKVLSLIYLPVLIGILGDEGYGIYAASYQIFIVIYATANSGLPQAISKLVSELTAVGNYKDAVKAFRMARSSILLIGAVLSIAFFLLSRYISNVLYYPRSYLAILALSPTIFLSTITSSYRGYFQGRSNMIPTAVSQVLEQVVNIIFTLLLAFIFIKHNVEEAAGGGALATSIAALITSFFLIRIYRKNKESSIVSMHEPGVKRFSNRELFNKIINYSLPLTAYAVLYNIGNAIDLRNTKTRLLFAGFTDSEATKLFGFLTKYIQLMGIPNAIITSLSVALLPAIAAAAARGEEENVVQKINMAFKICFLISLPSAVGLSVLSYPIYRLMGFGGGSYIMLYGAFVLVLMSCVQIYSSILQGLGRLYLVAGFLIIGITGKLAANYFLIAIPSINILGAILGNTVYYIIPLVLGNIILIKTLKTRINVFVHIVKPGISSAIMGGIIYMIYISLNYILSMIVKGYVSVAVPAVISITAGAYSYFYIMIRIKGITSEDLNVLPSRFKRFIPGHMLKLLK